MDKARSEARKLETEHERLQVEKRAQATPARVERLAKEQLQMRGATPAITQYVTWQARAAAARRRAARERAMSRSVAYTSSPLLASRTPVWRSKFIVAAIALGFVGLAGRAAWVQVFANEFFQKQGEVRFARTLELPANRGRILDRNGLMLATSVPVPSIWAIPEDVERDRAKLAQLARLLEMPLADLDKKLAGRRQDLRLAQAPGRRAGGAADRRPWTSRASTSARNTSASIRKAKPPRMWWASPTWRTRARRAWSSPSTRSWPAGPARAA